MSCSSLEVHLATLRDLMEMELMNVLLVVTVL